MTVQEAASLILDKEAKIESLNREIEYLKKQAEFPALGSIRPAAFEDLTPGTVVYFTDGDSGPFWRRVDWVNQDASGSFMADDGCHYNLLQGVYVLATGAKNHVVKDLQDCPYDRKVLASELAKTARTRFKRLELEAFAGTLLKTLTGHTSGHWGSLAWRRHPQETDTIIYSWGS